MILTLFHCVMLILVIFSHNHLHRIYCTFLSSGLTNVKNVDLVMLSK